MSGGCCPPFVCVIILNSTTSRVPCVTFCKIDEEFGRHIPFDSMGSVASKFEMSPFFTPVRSMCNPPFCYPTLGRFTPLRDLRFFHSCDNTLAAILFKIGTHLDLLCGIIHFNFCGFILHWAGNTGVRTPQKVENFGYLLRYDTLRYLSFLYHAK